MGRIRDYGNHELTRQGKSYGEPNLWLAFSGGVILAAIIWLMLHNGQGLNGDKSIYGWAPGTTNGLDYSQTQTDRDEHVDGNKEMLSKQVSDKAIDSNHTKTRAGDLNKAGDQKQSGGQNQSGDLKQTEKLATNEKAYSEPIVSVYLTESKIIEKVTLENYVRGVVAAEMPLDFKRAALEAQAIAARTYIIRRLWLNDRTGVPVNGVDVTDTQAHQVYRSLKQLDQLREDDEDGWRKVDEAVKATVGKVIIFGDQPIEALYFSTSNGYTESSEEVFSSVLPYLRSVPSPWDKENSPRTEEKVEMRLDDFYTKLGVKSAPAEESAKKLAPRVIEWTEGRRIKEMVAGNKRISGEEARYLLGLRSASFEWVISKNKNRITLTTYGSGHGVGMSQWGAEGMAKEGKTAEQIIQYYYSGTHIEEVSKLVKGTGKRL